MVITTGAGSEVAWKYETLGENSLWYKRNSFLLYALAFVGYLGPWIAIFQVFGHSYDSNPERDVCGNTFPPGFEKKDPPDFVWIAIIGLFVTFTSFAVNHLFKLKDCDRDSFLSILKYE